MLKHIVQKTRSERGASLSMVLFLFMVCAVVAGVVLAAASAAVGRQSKLEEMDKSYYNVSSAAKLFWEQLNEAGSGTVRVVRRCKDATESEGSFTLGDDWSESAIDSIAVGDTIYNANATLFQIAAYDWLFGSTTQDKFDYTTSRTFLAGDAKSSIDADSLEPTVRTVKDATYETFEITSSDSSLAPVVVSTERGSDGTLRFIFTEENNPSSYTCTLTATLDVNDSSVQRVRVGNTNTYILTWNTTLKWTADHLDLGGVLS